MLKNAWNFIVRSRNIASWSVIIAVMVIAAVTLWLLWGDADPKQGTDAAPTAAPVTQPAVQGSDPLAIENGAGKPSKPDFEANSEPKSIPAPVSEPAGTSFQYAACPPDVSWFPGMNATSGYTPAEQPVRQPLQGIRQISVGHLFDGAGYGMEFGTSYALAEDGSVYRWGVFEFGKGTRPAAFPQKLGGLPDSIVQVDGGFAMARNGDVFALNHEGGPRKIPELSGAIALAQVDNTSVYILSRDGSVQLYAATGPDSKPSLLQVHGFGEVKVIEASPFITLALTKDGTLRKAGGPFSSGPPKEPEPLALPDGVRVQQVETTLSYENPAFVLSVDNRWFSINDQGAVELLPVPEGMVQITATQRTIVGLKKDGTVWAWGDSPALVKSEGHPVTPQSLRQMVGLQGIRSIAAGTDHLLALTEDGRVLTVGSNMYGQLGRSPIYTADLLPLGTWRGADALFQVNGRIMAVQSGSLWELKGDDTVRPIVYGPNVVKAFPALGHFAVLTADGRLIVTEPEETKPCKTLKVPGAIMDASAAANGLLLALADGSVHHIEGNTSQVDKATKLTFVPEPKGKVKQVFGDPFPFILTDRGELYYKASLQEGELIMKPVDTKLNVKQWSPMHPIYSDGIGYMGKLLDQKNQVYELELKMKYTPDSSHSTVSVELRKTGRTAVTLAGGAEIDREGRIVEQGFNRNVNTHLPPGSRLRASSSSYHYPIEGRTYYQHLFAMKDGTLYWLGDAMYAGPELSPGEAVLSSQ
ncbi:hypothetical protein DVH26_05435 [Paenibacillus sp. H1-7]|uniref:RCC1 domain-containing protein n=1 Tax=Paenibacillus sp. H1-7 TaxID=2282849 RepID=UPI001EF78C94|nr:hypothetical protein [Paenibacillus sp. H1-7]ULL13938.1 hypothetical protein DVH26_05435 [Paenibacillus sp. H1-7]